MGSKLKVLTKEVKRFVEWSFFIESGDIHAQAGDSSVESNEINLANRLLNVYRNMKKCKVLNTVYNISFVDCEILQKWYHKLPECLLDKSDADLHAKLTVFIFDKS